VAFRPTITRGLALSAMQVLIVYSYKQQSLCQLTRKSPTCWI